VRFPSVYLYVCDWARNYLYTRINFLQFKKSW